MAKKIAKTVKKLSKAPKTKKAAKVPARRYIRRNTYYIATTGKDAGVLAPQPRTMVEAIQRHGRVERKALMRELKTSLNTCQPITRLFSFHRAALMRRKFFTEVKEPVGPMLVPVRPAGVVSMSRAGVTPMSKVVGRPTPARAPQKVQPAETIQATA